MMSFLTYFLGFVFYLIFAHLFSYKILKNKILKSRKWDLNICCGKTNGGGINADIKKHKNLPNFILIKNIYKLPFKNKQFNYVLCSHTIEHVDDPIQFYKELKRVGKNVVLVIPPLWDICAAFDITVHKWLFLTFKKKHAELPRFIPLPFANAFHKVFGQKIST